MKTKKLKIHSSHFLCGNNHLSLSYLNKLSDLVFIKKHKGITMDISTYKSEFLDIEYDDSNKY